MNGSLHIDYTGDLWAGPAVHPDLWSLLLQKNLLIAIAHGQPPYQVVLGVPHHAGPGIVQIAGDWLNPRTERYGRSADETTGLFGLVLFDELKNRGVSCSLVIAAHPADHDPNKTPGSPYWQQVFQEPFPALLFELHGAASRRRHDLELSAGRNQRADPLSFGRRIALFLDPRWKAAFQTRSGHRDALIFSDHQTRGVPGRLQNPALETGSLAFAGQMGIPALHLEMKPMFRQPDPAFPASPRPSAEAWQLAKAIAGGIGLYGLPR
jgi:hypothetical protein